jgi:hypothetical protein
VSQAFRAAVMLLAALGPISAFPQSVDSERLETLDEVVVVGRFPGPPLWKVSREGHALWILPLVDMYPKMMEWDSQRVEKLIGESQEYILEPDIYHGIYTSNPLHLGLLRGLYNAHALLPGTTTLADGLPPELHLRFKAVQSRHLPGDSSIEKMSVGAAPDVMQREILARENLSRSLPQIKEKIDKALKTNKRIRRTTTRVSDRHKVTSKELKALTATIRKVSAAPEYEAAQVICFERVLAHFEKDLDPVKRRANAWARGQVDDLVNPTPIYSVHTPCLDPFAAVEQLPAMQKLVADHPGLAPPDLEELRQKSRQKWLSAAENALSRNTTTFAVLPVNEVLDPDGLVAQLEARGYSVEISAEPLED